MVLDEDGEVDDEFKELARMDMESSEEARRKVDEDILEILLQCVKGELEVVARWAKMANRSGKQAISPSLSTLIALTSLTSITFKFSQFIFWNLPLNCWAWSVVTALITPCFYPRGGG